MLKSIQRWFYFYFLKKKLHVITSERKLIRLADAAEIGILFDASEPDRVSIINTFADSLRKEKKKIILLGYYNTPKKAINFNFPYFNKKDLNLCLIPVSDIIDEFIERKFDILINAYSGENLPLEYVSALSRASFRMGNFSKDKTYAYDFMIDTKNENDLKSLLNQYRHYLEMM